MPVPDEHEFPIHRTNIISEIRRPSLAVVDIERIKAELLVDIRDALHEINKTLKESMEKLGT